MQILLIHGAWQGGWAWDAFLPYLAQAGFHPIAIDLPGNGRDGTPPDAVSLDLYVAHVKRPIDDHAGSVALVAHSGGGVIASQVAEAVPERIACIVYLAGMMLPDGMSYAELIAPLVADNPQAVGIAPHLAWSDDRLVSSVPEPVAKHFFFHDCPPDVATGAARRLTPQPERGRAIRPRLSGERFGRVPRLYVEAKHDRSVVPAAQRNMQALVPGADVRTLSTGHAPHVAAPRALAASVVPWLAAHATGRRKATESATVA